MNSLLTPVALCILCVACSTGQKSASLTGPEELQGSWQLNYISGPRIAFEGLYPDQKPTLSFDIKNKKMTGNTSCNFFAGKMVVDGKKINPGEPVLKTKMACPGEGEVLFLQTLKKVNGYDVTAGYTLTLLSGDNALLRFTRVK